LGSTIFFKNFLDFDELVVTLMFFTAKRGRTCSLVLSVCLRVRAHVHVCLCVMTL